MFIFDLILFGGDGDNTRRRRRLLCGICARVLLIIENGRLDELRSWKTLKVPNMQVWNTKICPAQNVCRVLISREHVILSIFGTTFVYFDWAEQMGNLIMCFLPLL